jgi:hypothetical protein
VPPGTAPLDATRWTTSYTWADGGAISTARDLLISARALVNARRVQVGGLFGDHQAQAHLGGVRIQPMRRPGATVLESVDTHSVRSSAPGRVAIAGSAAPR